MKAGPGMKPLAPPSSRGRRACPACAPRSRRPSSSGASGSRPAARRSGRPPPRPPRAATSPSRRSRSGARDRLALVLGDVGERLARPQLLLQLARRETEVRGRGLHDPEVADPGGADADVDAPLSIRALISSASSFVIRPSLTCWSTCAFSASLTAFRSAAPETFSRLATSFSSAVWLPPPGPPNGPIAAVGERRTGTGEQRHSRDDSNDGPPGAQLHRSPFSAHEWNLPSAKQPSLRKRCEGAGTRRGAGAPSLTRRRPSGRARP